MLPPVIKIDELAGYILNIYLFQGSLVNVNDYNVVELVLTRYKANPRLDTSHWSQIQEPAAEET